MVDQPTWRSTPLVVALALLAALLAVTAAPARAAAPPGLSVNGRALWQFEALLTDTFHSRHVSAHGGNFACAGPSCTPAAYWSPYLFTFASPHGSAYHLSSKRFAAGAFGNYPSPVRVKGKLVACDAQERRFLIAYGDAAGFSLDCLTPN